MSQDVALALHDSTGTTLFAQAAEGQSLTIAEARDYAIELHNVTGATSTLIALALTVAP